jgi:hypothetical protein
VCAMLKKSPQNASYTSRRLLLMKPRWIRNVIVNPDDQQKEIDST